MKKILFVVPYLSGGGAERVVSIWASELARLGSDVHLLVFYRVKEEYSLDQNVILHSIKESKTDYGQMTKTQKVHALRRYFKELKPDVVLPFIAYVGYLTALAKIGLPCKVIETVRMDHRSFTKMQRIMRFLTIIRASGCIVQNQSQFDYFPLLLQRKTEILPNPISIELGTEGKTFTHKRLANVIAVGRLEKQKNFTMLINAFSEIVGDAPFMTLRIFGEGSQYNQLKKHILDLNLSETIQLCGRTQSIFEELKRADLFVLSSDAEGMPNALMEAMAVGLPCISTDCPTGPADLIEDKKNGLLIPVGETKALIQAMTYMISNVDESIEMGRRARRDILTKYSAQASTKDLKNLIESF